LYYIIRGAKDNGIAQRQPQVKTEAGKARWYRDGILGQVNYGPCPGVGIRFCLELVEGQLNLPVPGPDGSPPGGNGPMGGEATMQWSTRLRGRIVGSDGFC
jgi:hypothetical protein